MFKSFKTIFLEEIGGWGGNQYKSTRKKRFQQGHQSCAILSEKIMFRVM